MTRTTLTPATTAEQPGTARAPRPLRVDTESATRRRDRVGGAAAVLAGVLSAAIGVTQVLFPQDLDPAIDPRTRVILVGFSLVLWALVPVHLRLAARARSRWGGVAASCGTVLLTVGTVSSAVNGADLAIFPPVAVVANALWLVGSVALAVSLWRTRRVPRAVAALLVVVMPASILGSQNGGAVLAGGYLLVVGLLLLTARLDRRA
ncbi:hypothetical protein [Aquipuribacter sp. SD81]|uniref:hypothetical protein n=1 Tax=Aquipuribacter sp. SD81 TaxID=3127703 RepID=UPI003016629C